MVDLRLDRYRFACAVVAACWVALGCGAPAAAQAPGSLPSLQSMPMMPQQGMPGMASQGPGGMPLQGGMPYQGPLLGPQGPSTTAAPGTLLDRNRGPLAKEKPDDGPLPEEMPGSINQAGPAPGLVDATAPATAVSPEGLTGKEMVVDVRVEGHKSEESLRRLRRCIRTRVGRTIDRDLVEKDVRSLIHSKLVYAPSAEYQRVGNNGIRVIYHVLELPTIKYVKYFGNTIKKRKLDKKVNLNVGDPFNAGAVDEAKTRLVEFYQEKGYIRVKVQVVEGNKPNDRGVVFLINEGQKQKIRTVTFQGNTIASDSRLKTQIDSKPPLLFVFKGEVDLNKIEGDVEKLLNYYRGLGFFRAKIGRELIFDEPQKWLTLNFVIDEGPRYVVRKVTFAGIEKLTEAELRKDLKLSENQFFDAAKLGRDVTELRYKYGAKGYVFADIVDGKVFQEEPGELDIVYKIVEGKRFAVGPINIKILGDNPHTRRNTILNRLSIRPGDVMDIREIEASERRLKFSGLFMNNPAEGISPTIKFQQPEVPLEEMSGEPPRQQRGFRGQSPDGPEYAAARGSSAVDRPPSAERYARPRPPRPNGRGYLSKRGDAGRGKS
ncbi:MAG TPA: POTRA domain-containing protein [Pirellulales bacterium]|nr:POTRA domain-containing protein [Pirellulales bacterium]